VNAAAGQAKRYIDGYDSTDIDIDDITHAVGYTREHITRTFTAAYGMTPMQYVVSKKMNIALHSLESGDTVTEIAEALGYSSPYALSRAFKKYYGLPPGKYIKTLK
jgi:AraC-like DNA-binding protein